MKLYATLLAGLILVSPTTTASQISPKPVDVDKAVCLAQNMYYEARNQGSAGILAVTAVVFNRVRDSRFPNTICEVIKQGPTRESWKTRKIKILPPEERKYYPVKNRCQFSWYCDGKSDKPKAKKLYKKYLNISKAIINSEVPFIDITDGATFYHADYVTPAWAKSKIKTVEIQDHIFYRWKK